MPSVCESLGDIPETYTDSVPPTASDIYVWQEGTGWTVDSEKASVKSIADASDLIVDETKRLMQEQAIQNLVTEGKIVFADGAYKVVE
jgi:hypothetical protein